MSTSQVVAQYLPYLRRYARALTGNQQSGDAYVYVTATLEALIEDPSILPKAVSPRIALYKLFTKIWTSVSVNGKSAADGDNHDNHIGKERHGEPVLILILTATPHGWLRSKCRRPVA